MENLVPLRCAAPIYIYTQYLLTYLLSSQGPKRIPRMFHLLIQHMIVDDL